MSLFVLAETPAGYGLFKASDRKMLKDQTLAQELGRPEKLVEMLKLKKFVKFDSAAMALEEAASIKDGKIPELLSSLLDDLKAEKKASVAVADMKLGTAISSLPQFKVTPVAGPETMDMFRGIREHLSSLIPGLEPETIDRMSLGLSHSMSRHKLRFSAEKADSMIIQAVKLLDDMDKELNVYAMRTKEWYGWHFPEMARILGDNLAYVRVILKVGMRTDMADADLSDILPEELEAEIKEAAEISMGTEIMEEDLANIKLLAEQVVAFTDCRRELSSYLETRMRAIAPNLTMLVGYLVGARLVAHAGSLLNLAKAPGSTIQILGAEKALFRALKTKHDTPKYGIIYHSSLIGQASGRNKGKIARMLAAKTALGLRVDALGDEEDEEDEEARHALGLRSRIKLENALRRLEGKPLLPKGANVAPSGDIVGAGQFVLKENRAYNADADGVENGVNGHKKSTDKKSKKAKIDVVEERDNDEDMDDADSADEDSGVEVPKLSDAEYERLAEAAGISVKKFKRKYERGDVELSSDGTPRVYSKKELKKMRKAEAKAEAKAQAKAEKVQAEEAKVVVAEPASEKKKRKHEDDEQEVVKRPKKEKKEKKEKKKRLSLDA